MKVILSRKGFDSVNGNISSIILPNKELISFPIPTEDSKITFFDLHHPVYGNYYTLINNLKSNQLLKNTHCHLDPDIYQFVQERDEQWQPLFGPYIKAFSHLKKHKVKENDLFLFFGSFREIDEIQGIIKYKTKSQEIHLIFGYFQIGKIIEDEKDVQDWMRYHPHIPPNKILDQNNVVFIARKRLSFNQQLPGAAPLHYLTEDITLTKKEGVKYLVKSKWCFNTNTFGAKIAISYHNLDSWKENYFQSAKIGQEFVLEEKKEVELWAKNIIEKNFIAFEK